MPKLDFKEQVRRVQTTQVRCQVALVARSMSKAQREDLIDAIEDPTLQATAISRVMRAQGKSLPAKSIQRHRRKECACAPV